MLSAGALMLSVWSTREGNERVDRDAQTEQMRRFRDNLARVSELRGEAAQADGPTAAAYQEEMTLRMREAAELAVGLGDELSSTELAATAYLLADVGDPRAIDLVREAARQPMDDATRLDVLPVIAMVEFRFGNPSAAREHLGDAVAAAETVAAGMEVEDPEAIRHEVVGMAFVRWATAEATFGECSEALLRLDEAETHISNLGPAAQALFAEQAGGVEDLPACA